MLRTILPGEEVSSGSLEIVTIESKQLSYFAFFVGAFGRVR